MEEDFYKVLGISRNATKPEIEKAYRRMARKYHPDLNPDDAAAKERFQQVQRAYDVLSDTEKREMYDRYGSSFEEVRAGGGPQWRYSGGEGGAEEIDLGDMFRGFGGDVGGFEQIFRQFGRGGGGRSSTRRAPVRGQDLQASVEIPFQTAITGGETSILVNRAGRTDTISVKIPPGIEAGKKIRLRGQGEPSPRGGTAGDLLLTVHVAPHPCYRRRGNDLEVDLPVTIPEAVFGAKVDLPTPRGIISVKIPPGTSSGQKLRLKGQGVAVSGQSAGDVLANIQVMVPKSIDDAMAESLKQLQKHYPADPRASLLW